MTITFEKDNKEITRAQATKLVGAYKLLDRIDQAKKDYKTFGNVYEGMSSSWGDGLRITVKEGK